MVNAIKEPQPLTVEDIYEAIPAGVAAVKVGALACGYRMFVDGAAADDEKRICGQRFRRPPAQLPSDRISVLDGEATCGRRYMLLQMLQPTQDLVVTLFMRFSQQGKLIFCEFASYVLPPGTAKLYRIGNLFRINALLYLLYALVMAVLVSIGCGLFYLLFVALIQMLSGPGTFGPFLHPGELALGQVMMGYLTRDYLGAVRAVLNPGLLGYAVVVTSLTYLIVQGLWRGLRWLAALLGILLNVTRQFGVLFTYRERFASRSSLGYYALQEVVRFLKIQEKILIKSIYELLKEREIDASDFKESLSAYINQGVINSGDIRGDVFTRIKSFVGRRPPRTVIPAKSAPRGFGGVAARG
jgi:hypothetical protein